MKIIAVADVHSPKFLREFDESLSIHDKPDLLLLAGDMINFGKASEYTTIIEVVHRNFAGIPIYACFGNEEKLSIRVDIINLMNDYITFLNETNVLIESDEMTLGVIGMPSIVGILDKYEKISGEMKQIFKKRSRKVREILAQTIREADKTILLTHYNPVLEGTNGNWSFSWWGSEIFKESKPDYIIHGHTHRQDPADIIINGIRVLNVAFPARRSVTELRV